MQLNWSESTATSTPRTMSELAKMDADDVHPEYHGLTKCPFCGKDKSETALTCSRPSCETEMLEREGLL